MASDFYLTKSPHCSSILEPDNENLKNWAYSSLFEVENKIKVKTENLSNVIEILRIDKIDWFKTDSQGIDLRLFKCLGKDILEKVLLDLGEVQETVLVEVSVNSKQKVKLASQAQ